MKTLEPNECISVLNSFTSDVIQKMKYDIKSKTWIGDKLYYILDERCEMVSIDLGDKWSYYITQWTDGTTYLSLNHEDDEFDLPTNACNVLMKPYSTEEEHFQTMISTNENYYPFELLTGVRSLFLRLNDLL